MAASKRGAARSGKPAPTTKRGKPVGKPAGARPGRKRRAEPEELAPMIEVRRIHRRDLNRVWEFLKLSFAHVNPQTVEYQRPRTKKRFEKTYEEEGVEQLVFEVGDQIVAYAECAHEVVGSDNWINEAYFENRNMRPLFVEELAVHPDWNGRGVGGFVLEQLHHLAKVRGLTHLVLEVAENNEHALSWYRKRNFRKLDAAIFLAASVENEPELLPPKPISMPPPPRPDAENPPPAPIPEE
jgi:ribosomal protein S18 acetylase RimI-like enzyme